MQEEIKGKKTAIKNKAKVLPKRRVESIERDEAAFFEEEIYNAIVRHVYSNSRHYHILGRFEGCMLIAKSIRATIIETNANNIFMPYDKTKEKGYCILFIAEYSDRGDRPEVLKDLVRLDCPILDIGSPAQIKELFDGV